MLNPKTCFFLERAGRSRFIARPTLLVTYQKNHHYRSGYSMAEAAECWIAAGGRLPRRVAELVGDDSLDAAHFEYGVTVWGQGGSMTDIMAFIPDDLIAEEAKVRETFGEEVWYWINQDREKKPRSPPYRLRVGDRYAQAFGVCRDVLLELRYQLLHRSLAAALVARRSGRRRARMIVQSFCSSSRG